ncbi:putative uncharacterized protein DDB_G0282499 [Eupeodes corollae]|uniref:putative uncharacterized protein DDB_G0282499 n=1 Tax=Eupeodes corollae TaxID=290404 RepID=UPI002491256C|nr:putative uncharacterized protein DDB_G0282499 [Eupeodes corollae]
MSTNDELPLTVAEEKEQEFLLKELQQVPPFRGASEDNLALFISAVEYLMGKIIGQANIIKATFTLHHKIQGEAIRALNALTHLAPWRDVKNSLVRNYSVKESYLKLAQEVGSVQERNTNKLYEKLDSLLQKIQTKAQLEPNFLYTQSNNELLILEAFKSNLTSSQKAIIIASKCTTMMQAYDLLESNSMLNNDYVKKPIDTNKNFNNYIPKQNHFVPRYNNMNKNPNNVQRNNNLGMNSAQIRTNNNQVLGNHRQNPFRDYKFGFQHNYNYQPQNRNYQGQNNNYQSQNYYRNPNYSRQIRQEPMEVNRLTDEQNKNSEEVNFIQGGQRHFLS